MNLEAGFQLRDLRAVLRRRRAGIAVVSGAVFLASVVLAAVLLNQYESWTTVLVEPQAVSARLVEAGLESSDLNARLHLMTMQILSRARLSRVIDQFELYPNESEEMTREAVINHMRDNIRVEPVLPEMQGRRGNRAVEINTFKIFFRYESSGLAALVANRLGNDFIEQHIKGRVQISGDTSEFIASELAQLSTRIREVEARIAQVKTENAGRLPEDLTANQRLLERALYDYRLAQRQLDEARSDESFYRQQLASLGVIGGPGYRDNPMRRLEQMELDLGSLRARGLTDKHPNVIFLQTEIAELRKRLEAGADGEGPEEMPLDPIQATTEAERRRAQLRVQALEREVERVRTQIDEIQDRIGATPRVAERLSVLQREYEHLFDNYQQFSDKLQDASVAANMERRQKGEQFRMLETAYPASDPVSPNRPLILVLGAMLGLTVGVGVGILLEAADTTFYDARRLQAALDIPVLAAIPSILLDSDRAALRRRRLQVGLATSAIVAVVLTGAAYGYGRVNGVPNWLPEFGSDAAVTEGAAATPGRAGEG